MTYFDPSKYTKGKRRKPEPDGKIDGTPTPEAAAERYFTPPEESEPELDGFELAELVEIEGTVFDRNLYEAILAQPEVPPYKEYRKLLGKFVVSLSQEEKDGILARRGEIEEAEEEWRELNYAVLRRLGFNDSEANMLRDKRLASPGMRRLMRIRREGIKKVLKAKAVLEEVG